VRLRVPSNTNAKVVTILGPAGAAAAATAAAATAAAAGSSHMVELQLQVRRLDGLFLHLLLAIHNVVQVYLRVASHTNAKVVTILGPGDAAAAAAAGPDTHTHCFVRNVLGRANSKEPNTTALGPYAAHKFWTCRA
jgi:hypothetical protein